MPVRVRRGAILGLSELGSVDALLLAIHLAERGPAMLRPTARIAVARFRSPRADPLLLEVLADSTAGDGVRCAACQALASAKAQSALPEFSRLLTDESECIQLRIGAAEALGRLGDPDAVPAIDRVIESGPENLARVARLARSRLLHSR